MIALFGLDLAELLILWDSSADSLLI